jgi:hypothetical protein
MVVERVIESYDENFIFSWIMCVSKILKTNVSDKRRCEKKRKLTRFVVCEREKRIMMREALKISLVIG